MYKRFIGQRRVHVTNDQQMSLLRRTTEGTLLFSLSTFLILEAVVGVFGFISKRQKHR